MAVGCRLLVDGSQQIQALDDAGWSQGEVLFDQFHDGFFRNGIGPIGVHADGNRPCHTDGIRQLDFAFPGQAGCHHVLGYVTGCVGRTPVHLGGILPGESAAPMTGHAAIGIHDDFPPGQTGIPLRTADDEPAGGIDVVDGVFVQQVSRNHRFDYVFQDVPAQLFHGNFRSMLGGDHNGIHADRFVVFIFHRHLGFTIRTQVWQDALLAHLGQPTGQLMSQGNGQRHVFRGLVGGVSEHHTLVAGADLFVVGMVTGLGFVRFIHPLGNIRRLFIDGNQDSAGGPVKAVFGTVITNIDHRLPGNLGDVHVAAGGNFPYNMDLACRHQGFTSHSCIRVFFQDGIQHRIRNLIGNLVRMPFRHRFRRKDFSHSFLLAKKILSKHESTYGTLISQSDNALQDLAPLTQRPWLLWLHRAIPSTTLDELYVIVMV